MNIQVEDPEVRIESSQMASSAHPRSTAARRVAACQRCRRRKQKCDLKHPNCSNCESAHVSCLTYHPGKRAEIPRNYVSELEAQIEKLTRQNEDLQERAQSLALTCENPNFADSAFPTIQELSNTATEEPGTPNEGSSHLQDLVKSVRNVVVEPSRQPRFLGPSSGLTLARMVMASVRIEAPPNPPQVSKQVSNNLPSLVSTVASESSLPPRHAAEHLVEVYFQYRTPHMPIVQRSQVEKALENAYAPSHDDRSSDREIERDTFTTYMVLAIALCNVPNPTGGTGRVTQSEGCFRSAIGHIEKIIAYSRSDVETLRAVLLLAQFVSMCPWQGSLWHLTGIALRLCIDTGLHWETETQLLNTDPDLLYERRRLWYSAYYFDRVLGITLGRPFGIMDESTRVPLPNPWAASAHTLGPQDDDFDMHHQRAHNHVFSMSKLESEIKHVQNSQTWPAKLACPKPDLALWARDIRPRLQEWYGTIPLPAKAHPSSIFANQAYWDAIYENSILLFYRPHSGSQHFSAEALSISHNSARNLITSIKALQREGKLDVLWRWVHHLLMAGLTVIYGLWQSKEIRDRHSVGDHLTTLQSCASTLSAMSETFRGAVACRDIFDTLSSATISWLVSHDNESPGSTLAEFEKQVEDLMQQLQASRGDTFANESNVNDMTTMLSTDNFGFGEMLSSAAQWPEFLDMNFDDLGHEHFMT